MKVLFYSEADSDVDINIQCHMLRVYTSIRLDAWIYKSMGYIKYPKVIFIFILVWRVEVAELQLLCGGFEILSTPRPFLIFLRQT